MIKLIGLFILLPLLIWSLFFAPPVGTVTREDFGEAWPLTVESGVLECLEGDQVVFTHDGTTYQVNGAAGNAGYKNIRGIWADGETAGTKKNIVSLIEAGQKRC